MADLNKLAEELMELANSRQLEMEGSAVLAEAAALLRAAAGADVQGLMDLHDEAAEARHVNGAPVYNAKSNAARAAVETALRLALPVWRPIEEAPQFTPLQDPVPPCLVYSKDYGVCMGAAGRDKFGHIYTQISNVCGDIRGIVTHYMPLPPQPKGQP